MDYLKALDDIRKKRAALAAKDAVLREQSGKLMVEAREAGHVWPDLQRASGLSPEGARQVAIKANKGVLPVPLIKS